MENGELDDPGKELRRCKAWAQAKLMTLDKLTEKQRGPRLFTLLSGAACEAVEHFTLEELASETGAEQIWKALHASFPEKEKHDQMGEVLGEVFSLAN